ncbi:Uma2 family endonuclease [Thiothrix eikelboomii]|uniref:Endonuclease, Uma2 family (Restriction endonuclease fold) n=1 Tax=Thiothrix eikelboomii TaxID=92487 RepID=A0A1T4XLD1_9GAMM|nr:Uma2 family endonuclease [Thiothrix eikelboomii]SKA90372.1 Endonuclease, Uma2 family (restriction endonuclease fold) [Thiothrix eikelboomii]
MVATALSTLLTVDAYLQGEADAMIRHEYVRGEVYAMAGAGDGHVRISGNVFALLKADLRGSGCSVYMADMKVRVKEDEAFFYPDVMVTCDPADLKRNYTKHAPRLVIEVLSASTEGYDRGLKFALYREISSLQEYVLIDPRSYRVDVFRRNVHNRWELFAFTTIESQVEFASLNFRVAMQAIYEDVDFELVGQKD